MDISQKLTFQVPVYGTHGDRTKSHLVLTLGRDHGNGSNRDVISHVSIFLVYVINEFASS